MKKHLLTVLFLGISFSASSQTSGPFLLPDSNAIWNVQMQSSMCWPYPTWDYSIRIAGDTSIQGQVYHWLHTPFVLSSSPGVCGMPVTTGYKGAFRNDTLNQRVLFIAPYDSVEHLFYDYHWQVGDTLTGFFEEYLNANDTVFAVDSVLIGAQYHKRWVFYPHLDLLLYDSLVVIDGIGSLFGLLQAIPPPIDGDNYNVECFSQDGIPVFPDSSPCILISGIPIIERTHTNIHPNPFHDVASIAWDRSWKDGEMAIYDMTGRMVRKEPIHGTSTLLYRKGLPNGVYFLEANEFAGRAVRIRFILQ